MFCPNCGNSIANSTSNIAPTQSQEAVPPMQQQWSQSPKKSKALPIVLSILGVLLVAIIAVACFVLKDGIGKDDSEKETTKRVEEQTTKKPEKQTIASDEKETDTEKDTTSTSDPQQVTIINRNGTTFTIPDGFIKNEDEEGNYLRYDSNGEVVESFFFSYQDGYSYEPQAIYDEFEGQIESVYGTEYTFSKYESFMGYEFNRYEYEDCSIADGYYINAYLYSDGKKVIYFEDVTLKGEETNILKIVNTMDYYD